MTDDPDSAVSAARAAGYAEDSHTMRIARALDRQIDISRQIVVANKTRSMSDNGSCGSHTLLNAGASDQG